MLTTIIFVAIVIAGIVWAIITSKQPKVEETTSIPSYYEDLAPEATPEPSIVEAVNAPAKPKKKPAAKKPAVKMDAKKKPAKKVNKK